MKCTDIREAAAKPCLSGISILPLSGFNPYQCKYLATFPKSSMTITLKVLQYGDIKYLQILLCTGHSSKHFTYINSFNPHDKLTTNKSSSYKVI